MKKIFPFLSSLLFLSVVFAGCNKSKQSPSLWSPLDAEADSLVEYLQMRTDSTIFDESDSVYALRIDSIGRAKGIDQLRARAAYFKLLVTNRKGIKERHAHILDSIVAMTDSATFPYDYHRFMLSMPRRHFKSPRTIQILSQGAEFMKQYGDSARYAETCNKLAVNLLVIGDTLDATRYLQTAVDYYTAMGQMPQAAVVWYNLAYITFDSGEVEKAGKMIDSLMQLPEFTSYVSNIQQGEIIKFYQTHNPDYLHHILALTIDKYSYGGTVPWAAVYLADHYREVGNRDSMLFYKQLFSANIPGIRFNVPHICETAAKVYEACGDPDSAKLFRDDAATMWATREAKRMATLTMRAENEGAIREAYEALEKAKNSSEGLPLWKVLTICALAMLIFGSITLVMVRRHLSSRREEAAPVSDEKKEALELLRKYGRFTPDMLPEFRNRLAVRYPDLSPAESRMACLIYMGLDTKEIATLLSITPDSVKKSRQRLRARLNLSPADDLTACLSSL